jgi:hypothetical protein
MSLIQPTYIPSYLHHFSSVRRDFDTARKCKKFPFYLQGRARAAGKPFTSFKDVVDLAFPPAPDCPRYIYSPINGVDTFYIIKGDHSNSSCLFENFLCNPNWPNIDWVD